MNNLLHTKREHTQNHVLLTSITDTKAHEVNTETHEEHELENNIFHLTNLYRSNYARAMNFPRCDFAHELWKGMVLLSEGLYEEFYQLSEGDQDKVIRLNGKSEGDQPKS